MQNQYPGDKKTLPKKQIMIIQGGGRPNGNTAQLISPHSPKAPSPQAIPWRRSPFSKTK